MVKVLHKDYNIHCLQKNIFNYNEANSYLFVNGKEIDIFKAKGFETRATPSCLGNVSKDWSVDEIKKKLGINGYVYDFSVNYEAIGVANILDIYKFKMLYKMLRFVKELFASLTCFSCNLSNGNPLKCASMKDQQCKIRPEIINVNSDEPLFYPYNVKINTCSCSCNNINNPYAKMCIPDVVKNINI